MVAGADVREALPARVEALERAGAEVVAASSLAQAFAALAGRDVTTVLVEGGARLHEALWREGLIDRLHLVVAPIVLGPDGVPLFGGHDVPWSSLRVVRVEPRGDDIWIEADVHRAH
jgi:diaminohydroxyphosphoribosylaminopyrimidine deaminase/5-amino-6-(5-phosphoribosylamino)uracil reductase